MQTSAFHIEADVRAQVAACPKLTCCEHFALSQYSREFDSEDAKARVRDKAVKLVAITAKSVFGD